jgi:hypothetical protein
VAGHESQVSHCVQPLMKLWHHVMLCELPFCAILVDSPANLLMPPRFCGPEALLKGILCSISRYLVHVPGKAGDRFLNAVSADSLHCRDPAMGSSCSCPPSPLYGTGRYINTDTRRHTQTHTHTRLHPKQHPLILSSELSVALDQMSSRRPCTVSSHPTLLLAQNCHVITSGLKPDICIFLCP